MIWLVVVEWLARLVLFLLIGLSVWSITIIVDRKRSFEKIKMEVQKIRDLLDLEFDQLIKRLPSNSQSKSFEMLNVISRIEDAEKLEKAFSVFIGQEKMNLEKGLPILGTLGSTTPFIGLFGTILGIIVAFGELSQGGGDTNQVMFALAEALVLTAIGLVVAIPAVIAFNFFNKKMKNYFQGLEILKNRFLSIRK